MALDTNEFGYVSRGLPQAIPDGQPRIQRLGRYGGVIAEAISAPKHVLADEGSYFITSNAQTGITGQTNTAFTATAPTLSIYNSDLPSNPQAKRIYLDYLYLLNGATAFSNATSNTGTFCAVTIDSQDSVTGGTLLTAKGANMDDGRQSVSVIRFGALTAPAASAAARTLVGQRLVRMPVSATALTLANIDQFMFTFGFTDASMALPNAGSATLEANAVSRLITLPPIVIGPGHSAWVYIFSVAGGAVTAGTFIPEIGHWER